MATASCFGSSWEGSSLLCGSSLDDPGNRALLDANGDASVDLSDAVPGFWGFCSTGSVRRYWAPTAGRSMVALTTPRSVTSLETHDVDPEGFPESGGPLD
jgi:hypothetical protein